MNEYTATSSKSHRAWARPEKPARLHMLISIWGVAVASWLGYLVWYTNAPGAQGASAADWPADSAIQFGGEKPALLMFIHPHCPCTDASVEELARVAARCPELAEIHCVFVRPAGEQDTWAETDLWRFSATIPGVRRFIDDGTEARRFGAETSGQVQLFDAHGRLLFRGGITAARSHAGDNAGTDAVTSWLRTGRSECSETFVFGCSLF